MRRYKSGEVPTEMVTSLEAAGILGLKGAAGMGRYTKTLARAGTVAGSRGNRGKPLYWRVDVERVAAANRATRDGLVTAQEAAGLLGVRSASAAYHAMKVAGLRSVGRRYVCGNLTMLYPRAAVEQLAADRTSDQAVAVEADRAADELAVRADRDVLRFPSSNDYDDAVVLPQVLYGLLDHHDVKALDDRRRKNPDWRPRMVA